MTDGHRERRAAFPARHPTEEMMKNASLCCALALAVSVVACSSNAGHSDGSAASPLVDKPSDPNGDAKKDPKGDPNGDPKGDPKGGCDPGGKEPPPVCEKAVIGDGKSCLDFGTLKALAPQLCQSKKLEAIVLSFGEACPGGATNATVECCEAKMPPKSTCEGFLVGDGKTCRDYGTIKLDAANLCAAKNLSLATLSARDDCANGATEAKVDCCEEKQGGGSGKDPGSPGTK